MLPRKTESFVKALLKQAGELKATSIGLSLICTSSYKGTQKLEKIIRIAVEAIDSAAEAEVEVTLIVFKQNEV